MHIVIAWEIRTAGARATAITDALSDVLKPYSWVRLFNTFLVVKIDALAQRERLVAALVALGMEYGDGVRIAISPTMCGGTYTGWLPDELWEKVNERTNDNGKREPAV